MKKITFVLIALLVSGVCFGQQISKIPQKQLDLNGYAKESWVEGKGYSTGTDLTGELSGNWLTINSDNGTDAHVDLSPIVTKTLVQIGTTTTSSATTKPIDTVWINVGQAALLDVKVVLIEVSTLETKAIEAKCLIKGGTTPSIVAEKDIISETEFSDLTGQYDFSLIPISPGGEGGIKIVVTASDTPLVYWKSETTITMVTGVLP